MICSYLLTPNKFRCRAVVEPIEDLDWNAAGFRRGNRAGPIGAHLLTFLGVSPRSRREPSRTGHFIGTSEATAAKTSSAGTENRIIRRIRVNMASSIDFMFTI
jgi:hypothetical protein